MDIRNYWMLAKGPRHVVRMNVLVDGSAQQLSNDDTIPGQRLALSLFVLDRPTLFRNHSILYLTHVLNAQVYIACRTPRRVNIYGSMEKTFDAIDGDEGQG